ncbi:ATP-binding cassette domain-containing protein [Nocardia sp. NPDC003963]
MTTVHIPASPGPRVAQREIVLRIRGVRSVGGQHPVVPVLADINFDLRRGERLGVTGGRGAGKSALARALVGAADPGQMLVAGRLEFDDAEYTLGGSGEGSAGMSSRIVLLDDLARRFAPGAPIGHRIGAEIRASAAVRTPRQVRHYAIRLLSDAGIHSAAEQFDTAFGELSRDGRLRVLVAAALARRPDVLVVDDPLMDRIARSPSGPAVLCEVAANRDIALIVMSRDTVPLSALCDTVQVLLAGKIVERGPARSVLDRPRHRYTAQLRRGATTFGRPPRPSPAGCAFEPVCPRGHGRSECRSLVPGPTAYSSPAGSVTAKCHFPVDGICACGCAARIGDPGLHRPVDRPVRASRPDDPFLSNRTNGA